MNKRKQLYILISLVAQLSMNELHAQIQDNFADGDYTANPVWIGETANFDVSTNRLHLNAPAVASSAYLSTPSSAIHNASWEFYVEMGFATSSTSLTRVYLVSDQPDLKQLLNGYFVMIGNTDDEISLYRQTGNTSVKIIDGVNARVALSTVSVKVKVTRDDTGNWNLYSDTGATGPTGTYVSEGTVNDVTHTVSSYFGVHCIYIASRSTLFWFDDIQVTGTAVPDMTPPSVTDVSVINPTTVLINFSEAIEAISAQSTSNYSFNQGVGNPTLAVRQADNKSVLLNLSNPLVNGITYTLQTSGVEDTDGNPIGLTTNQFLYFVPMPVNRKDIIVTEFMADPSPVVGLPESEFVELFNRSAYPVDLQGWKLTDGSTMATLPVYILMPVSRLLVAPASTANLFSEAVGVSTFPSLNNSGDNIILKDVNGITIDSISYTQAWYHSDEKKDGGWSLEIIDPENICEEEGNWTASENPQGGTPGMVNSVLASNPDITAPQIESAFIVAPSQLEISFNEKLNGNEQVNMSVNPTIDFSSVVYSSFFRKLILTATTPFLSNTLYSITLTNIHDCAGNGLENTMAQFVLPETPESGDLLINEILFNPKAGGVDFVELFNKSTKYISLKKWSLANVENEHPVNNKEIEEDNLVISPNSFLVFSTDPSILKAHYPRTIESVSVTTALPSLSDDEGSIALVDSLGNMIDHFQYSDDFHVIFLKDKEGVSLERVSLTATTNDSDNWRSASQAENFATPGYKNSASAEGTVSNDGDVLVEPEIFSPQVPPNDFTRISYRFNQSGYVANAIILDHQGREIKVLANNEVLGTEGFFRWDGDRQDGGRARAGYYIAWVEVFNHTGQVTTFRKRVMVAYR